MGGWGLRTAGQGIGMGTGVSSGAPLNTECRDSNVRGRQGRGPCVLSPLTGAGQRHWRGSAGPRPDTHRAFGLPAVAVHGGTRWLSSGCCHPSWGIPGLGFCPSLQTPWRRHVPKAGDTGEAGRAGLRDQVAQQEGGDCGGLRWPPCPQLSRPPHDGLGHRDTCEARLSLGLLVSSPVSGMINAPRCRVHGAPTGSNDEAIKTVRFAGGKLHDLP